MDASLGYLLGTQEARVRSWLMASIDSALSPVKPGRKELGLAPYALHGQTKLACIHECPRQAVF